RPATSSHGANGQDCDGHTAIEASDASPNRKKRRHKFLVRLTLKELEGVTLSNGVLFAKMRLLSGGRFCQYSSRCVIQNNKVTWLAESGAPDATYEFPCRMTSSAETGVLHSCELRVSLRKEIRGGRSYSKLGFVNLDLAQFGHCSAPEERAFILTPYSPNERLDNSTLRLSLCMRCLRGDPIYRASSDPARLRHSVGGSSCGGGSDSATAFDSVVIDDAFGTDNASAVPMVTLTASGAQQVQQQPQQQHAQYLLTSRHCRNLSTYSNVSSHSRSGSGVGLIDFPRPGSVSVLSTGTSDLVSGGGGGGAHSLERSRSEVPPNSSRIINTRADNHTIVKQVLREQGIHLPSGRIN
ncbi:hypothetical protein BOX15_Mlig023496g1, partial [Macrostomum lignano]